MKKGNICAFIEKNRAAVHKKLPYIIGVRMREFLFFKKKKKST